MADENRTCSTCLWWVFFSTGLGTCLLLEDSETEKDSNLTGSTDTCEFWRNVEGEA